MDKRTLVLAGVIGTALFLIYVADLARRNAPVPDYVAGLAVSFLIAWGGVAAFRALARRRA